MLPPQAARIASDERTAGRIRRFRNNMTPPDQGSTINFGTFAQSTTCSLPINRTRMSGISSGGNQSFMRFNKTFQGSADCRLSIADFRLQSALTCSSCFLVGMLRLLSMTTFRVAKKVGQRISETSRSPALTTMKTQLGADEFVGCASDFTSAESAEFASESNSLRPTN